MPATEPIRARWTRLTHSLSAKLVLALVVSMSAVFALQGYLIVHLHRQHLEQSRLASAERISDVIRRSTAYYMLRNDRTGLYHTMETMADQPGIIRIRIFDQEGRISYSTDSTEISHIVDKSGEACYACHSQSQPLAHLDRPDRFRIYRNTAGQRILAIINPIENQPGCSTAECHAHPASQRILGVLDTNLSLATTDVQIAQSTRQMIAYMILALSTIAMLSWVFVWSVVGKPIGELRSATERLAKGHLGYQIADGAQDEIGDLERAFNGMSSQLSAANAEIVSWAATLEDRVDQKTRELTRAHEHLLQAEKMASLGKMAAVVAHEVNNPLSGILTYAKLLRKWVTTGQVEHEKQADAVECLDLIASESRRCGELVKNLLSLSRTAPMNLEIVDLRSIIERCKLLMWHPLEMNGIQVQLDYAENLPLLQCDPAQIEQVLIALITNAMDAMPRGGNLWLKARYDEPRQQIEIQVRDDGPGIAPDILSKIFEPFFTTKDGAHGVGLGLAISRGIIERHRGGIEVESEIGKGTTFSITLPTANSDSAFAATGAGLEEVKVR
jgi:two-component system, NtrC family, sensor kinase